MLDELEQALGTLLAEPHRADILHCAKRSSSRAGAGRTLSDFMRPSGLESARMDGRIGRG